MTVKYAVQVLSATVSKVLKNQGSNDVRGTAIFCEMLDNFFDCMNVRSFDQGKIKRKPFLNPFICVNDYRFEWLENVFIKYLNDWKSSIINRQGEFTKLERECFYLNRHMKA